jgi:predicted DNA-binding transcriptional regulator AlpA
MDSIPNRHERRAHAALERRGETELPEGCEPAFDTPQAAAYTGLAATYLEKLRSVGGGPRFLRYGRRAVRYRKSDLDAWMSQHECFSTSEAA